MAAMDAIVWFVSKELPLGDIFQRQQILEMCRHAKIHLAV